MTTPVRHQNNILWHETAKRMVSKVARVKWKWKFFSSCSSQNWRDRFFIVVLERNLLILFIFWLENEYAHFPSLEIPNFFSVFSFFKKVLKIRKILIDREYSNFFSHFAVNREKIPPASGKRFYLHFVRGIRMRQIREWWVDSVTDDELTNGLHLTMFADTVINAHLRENRTQKRETIYETDAGRG